jgi:hypothetical protein
MKEVQMVDQLTHDTFAQQVGTLFRLQAGPERSVAVELSETSPIRSSGRYEAFSIILRGPSEMPVQQGTYHVDHDAIGSFDLFIVPIRQDSRALYYEACFNRLRPEER